MFHSLPSTGSQEKNFTTNPAISSKSQKILNARSLIVGHRPSYGRGTKCVFLGFCCVDATQVMGVMGWGGGDGNVP